MKELYLKLMRMPLHDKEKIDGMWVTRVIGGWIYNHSFATSEEPTSSESYVFVPEPPMKKEQYVERVIYFQNQAYQMQKEIDFYKGHLKDVMLEIPEFNPNEN